LIKDRLIEANVVKFGKFKLTSGKETDYYIDIKNALTKPDVLNEIVGELSKHVTSKAIAGIELGAVPLLSVLSIKLKIPYVIVRKVERVHGTKDLFVGEITKTMIFDIIEDVVTTGSSVMKAINVLKTNGAKVSKVICVVDREENAENLLKENGIKLISLLKASELIGK
jgi:orotate phosphoribosyltransferase